jgi:hypothetical protein
MEDFMKAFPTIVAITALGISYAYAGDGLNNAKWCETQTAAPAQSFVMAQKMPDGKLRGTRSAATLIAEAKGAARAGRDDEAIAWVRACQAHNPHAQQTIDADRAAVLAWLKS